MNVRDAAPADLAVVRELWEALYAECPEPEHERKDWDEVADDVRGAIEEHVALIAEVDGAIAGFLLARMRRAGVGYVSDLYVRPEHRRRGIGRGLLLEAAQRLRSGVVTLDVGVENAAAAAFYRRLGFADQSLRLAARADRLREPEGAPTSFGSVHVQTDDIGRVVAAVRQFVPRLPGGSKGSVVAPPRNGWVAVYDELCDRDPKLLGRLARELSDRMGAVTLAIGVEEGRVVRYLLYERGRMVDEYLSVPEHYGELPPGDVVALGANPTVVARLTGADPARIREIGRTARSPRELPPARQLLAALADAMRIEGAGHGYADAGEIAGAIAV